MNRQEDRNEQKDMKRKMKQIKEKDKTTMNKPEKKEIKHIKGNTTLFHMGPGTRF